MTLVETTLGKLEGVEREGHEAYLGVPFARPPVGKLRFAPTQAREPWTGVRPAKSFAPSAVQGLTHSVPGFAATGARSEDCLYLNVYTPAADGKKRPVLFWIHGGAYSYGSGSELFYDGKHLALRGDVVVVTIHYRLGVLGFAYLEGHGGEKFGAGINVGLLDQIAALRWTRENIAAFGGDPCNVTIFGESAGAVSVAALLAMPEAQGLFQRAICQSGTANRLGNTEAAIRATSALLRTLGLKDDQAEKLMDIPPQVLVDAQLRIGAGGGLFSPVWGVPNLPQRGVSALRAGVGKDVAVIVGTNRDEVKLFGNPDKVQLSDAELLERIKTQVPRGHSNRAAEVIETYRASRRAHGLPTTNNDMFDAINGDSRFRMSAIRMASAQSLHQPNTFLFLFTWESPARGGAMGSAHALEIPFVFGTLSLPRTDRFTGSGPEATRLSEDMMDCWLAFARTGNPSHANIGNWPAYDDVGQATMIFGPKREVLSPPFPEEVAIWNSMLG